MRNSLSPFRAGAVLDKQNVGRLPVEAPCLEVSRIGGISMMVITDTNEQDYDRLKGYIQPFDLDKVKECFLEHLPRAQLMGFVAYASIYNRFSSAEQEDLL